MIRFKARLLEVAPIKEFQGTKYSSISVRSEEIADGQIIKYKLDLSSVNHEGLSEMLDEDVVVTVRLIKGANSTASVKVVAVTAE